MALSGTSYLLLDVAGAPCALPRGAAAEILPLPELHRPAAAGGWILGLINLGGAPVPVIDLAALLGLRAEASEPNLYAHILLAYDRDIAYLVDRVTDLVTVAEGAIRPVDEAESLNGCVAAELSIGAGLVHALAPDRLLTVRERARVAAMARAEALRLAALPEPA